MKHIKWLWLILLLSIMVGCSNTSDINQETSRLVTETISLENIPDYTGSPYVMINDNLPEFDEAEITTSSYEFFSELDSLGRCGVVMACIGQDIMPTEDRGSIGFIKPSGWKTKKYDFVDGKYLYNRCHLIGFQLTGENDNENNLITGTRYLNVEGMLPFENLVADYVKETNNHVMYRVTPIYENNNLVANGVQMEGYSVEDQGAGVSFNVFCYNVQPGVKIDYANGNSWEYTEIKDDASNNNTTDSMQTEYILNTNSCKFHYSTCDSVDTIKEENKEFYTGSRNKLLEEGFEPCGNCRP